MNSARANWTVQPSGIEGSLYPNSIAFGNDRFVIGTEGNYFNPPANAVAWSDDGYTWHPAETIFTPSATVEFFQGYFYAAHQGKIHRSLNGKQWEVVSLDDSIDGIIRLAATDRILIGSTKSGYFAGITHTENGLDWRRTTLPQPTGGNMALSENMVSGPERIWMTYQNSGYPQGRSQVAYSANGYSWTSINSPLGENAYQVLSYGNGRLLMLDRQTGLPYRKIYSSTSRGVDFQAFDFNLSRTTGILFSAGRFFENSRLATSLNGLDWGPAAMANSELGFKDVAYGKGRYVAVGRDTSSSADYIAIWEASTPPRVTRHPQDRSSGVGRATSFSITTDYSATPQSYQWTLNGSPIPGATGAKFQLTSLRNEDAGWYACDVTNGEGTISSNPARLALLPPDRVSRLVNLSVRGPAGSGSATFVSGFVVGGGAKPEGIPLLVRSVGPTLNDFGVSDFLPDPEIVVFGSEGSKIANNDNWGGSESQTDAFSAIGAFQLHSPTSLDAAVQLPQTPLGAYSIHTLSHDGTSGVALSEVYEMNQDVTVDSPRLINLSCRALAGAGAQTLTGGFVVSGDTNLRVMIRAVGPGLAAFGVSNTLGDPRVTLRRHVEGDAQEFHSNDDWTTDTLDLQKQVGAFDLSPGSQDSVLIAELGPGVYSSQVTGVNGTSGIVLLEIYELP